MLDSSLAIFTNRELQIGFIRIVIGIFIFLIMGLVKPSIQFISDWLITLQIENTYQRLVKPNEGLLGVPILVFTT